MRPVHFAVWLTFEREKQSFTLSDTLFQVLSGKDHKPAPVAEKNVILKYPDVRLAINWTPSVCRVVVENTSDQGKCVDLLLSALARIDKTVPIEKITERRFLSFWILSQQNLDFAALERKYREVMITPNALSDAAFDSSVLFDTLIDKGFLHHQSGPMKPPQLLNKYLLFDAQDLPQAFLFLDASIVDQNVIAYANKEMRSFLLHSMNICVDHSRQFEQIWEGRL